MYNGVFEKINNANTAYWLGFLAADGCVFENKNQVQVGLSRRDKMHIEKFKRFIGSDADITDRDMICTTNGKSYPSSFIYVSDKKLVDDLSLYGIVSRKSNKNIDFLQYIPEQYKMHFILGYFDGNGYYIFTEKSDGFGWCGCEDNIKTITNYVKQYLKLTTNAECHKYKKSPTIYEFTDTKFDDIKMFCEFYLAHINIIDLLDRKVEKAKQLLIFVNDRIDQNLNNCFEKRISTCPICNKSFYVSKKSVGKYCSQECLHIAQRKTDHPDRDLLKHLIRTIPFLQIGKQFNVSDNAIRKWCKSLNLPYRSRDIKKYSDQEWINI